MADIDVSGAKGILAGMGAATMLPVAALAAARHFRGQKPGALFSAPQEGIENLTGKLGDSVGSSIAGKVSDKVDESGGLSGILKGALPFGGGGDDDEEDGGSDGAPGTGKGRRMPVQQSVDIGAPLETVYNQWTQYELWPNFMHRVTRVSQEDPCTVSFETKIWGKTKEFTAKIETQRPDERVKWKVSQGMTHTGVVTFHELGPRLTRVLLNLDVQPGGMIEKLARGARHVKRAARGDLHRFKALIEMSEQETGAWRGVIEDGEVVEDHDSGYDKKRDYADEQDVLQGSDEDKDGSEGKNARRSGGGGGNRSSSRARNSRGRSGSSSSRSGSSRAKAASASKSSQSSGASRSGSSGGNRRSSGRSPSSGSSSSRASRRSGSH